MPTVSLEKRFLSALVVILFVLLIPFAAFNALRVSHAYPFGEFGEGWNAYHTMRLLSGGPLYPELNALPLTPCNYPPLSFLILGQVSLLLDDIVLAGRLLSLASLVVVAALIAGIVGRYSRARGPALFGALVWLGLITQVGEGYLGAYYPEMLAHVFIAGAAFLYVRRWQEQLTPQRTWLLALICSTGLFIKHSLIAVPVALFLVLAFRNWKQALIFSGCGVIISGLFILVTWLAAGDSLFDNFLELNRQSSIADSLKRTKRLFFDDALGLVFVPILTLVPKLRREWAFLGLYFLCSLLWGSYIIGGAGVDVNAWFDLFISGSILVGLFAAETVESLRKNFEPGSSAASDGFGLRRRAPRMIGLMLCSFPVILNLASSLPNVLDYGRINRSERAFMNDVHVLRSTPGPVLFEDPFLGFAAGKQFLFDSFDGSLLMVAGQVPERVLLDPLRAKRFGAIALNFDLDQKLRRLNQLQTASTRSEGAKTTVTERWTDNTLRSIAENYERARTNGLYYFYTPQR
jgi:hypothetical protein